MIPARFAYHRPGSLEDAIRLLGEAPDARVLAGGHSLLPMMKLRLAQPATLIDIGGLHDLRFVRRDDAALTIGALTTHAEVAASDDVRATHAGLAAAAAAIGDAQVRNFGTLGGSLAHADPAADYAAAALALEAEVTAVGPDGARTIAAGDLFAGLFQTTLARGEIVTEVRFPVRSGARSAYAKFSQPASGFAIVGVCAEVVRDGDECAEARLAATGVGVGPRRLGAVEGALAGHRLDDETIAAACRQADHGLDDVRSDHYADADYRRHLLRVFARRALRGAAGLG